ncbi:MAG: PAS domain-containing protein [Chloroflexi bacterium]|nr:PAS domain-containing protein [Chloroflexota bacterium]
MGAEEKELERLRFAISVSGDAVYDWDVPTGEIIWSDNAPGILGVGELSEISSRDAFLARIDPEDHDVLAEVHARHLRDHRRFECEYRFRRQDGSYFWLCDRGLGEFGPGGEPLRVVGSVRGIEPSKQREARLVRLANYDDLTGQYNRSRLREALQSALTYSVRHGAPGAYMLGSIDNLTLINYTHGYEVAVGAGVAAASAELAKHDIRVP